MGTEDKKHLISFDVLKLIAILVILNSHFDSLYPDELKILATGGTWGNTLFFLISGYFTKIDNDFFPYMKKRIIRLYPPVIIFTLISIIFHFRSNIIENPLDVITEFIWPTYYWFVGALVLYYVLIFLLERRKVVSSKFTVFSIAFAIVFFVYYECCVSAKNEWSMDLMGFDTFESWLKVFLFFYVFSLGYYLKYNDRICSKVSMPCAVFLLGFGGLGYMGYKQVLIKGLLPMHLQICAPVLLYCMAFGALCITSHFAYKEEGSRNRDSVVTEIIICLSSLSLEIYVVQFTVIHFFEDFAFPFNAILTVMVTFVLAYLLKNLPSFIKEKIIKKAQS